MNIYMDMVNDYLHEPVYDTVPFKTGLVSPPESPDFYHRYLCIAEPSQFEVYQSSKLFQKRQYTPYKRLGHFREHLNRINFTQFVHIPTECFNIIDQALQLHCKTSHNIARFFTHNENIYFYLQKILSKHNSSKYIEHAHYLIHYYRNRIKPHHGVHCTISYTDYQTLCSLFVQFENQLILNGGSTKQKRLIPYNAVVQCFFTLLHIHPSYHIPYMKCKAKKWKYYHLILDTLLHTDEGKTALTTFKLKNITCTRCHDPEKSFPCYGLDRDVKMVLFKVLSSYHKK